jgi:hypothetical protein
MHHKAKCGGFKGISFATAVRDHGATHEGRTDPSRPKDLLSISQVFSLDVLGGSDPSDARVLLKVHSC